MRKYIKNDDLYKIIRDAYMNTFPKAIPEGIFNEDMYVSMISKYLVREMLFDEIQKTDNGYELKGEKTNFYKNINELPEGSFAYSMKELSNPENLNKFLKDTISDLNEFHEWLVSEKYISSGRLTEKFITQEKWFEI